MNYLDLVKATIRLCNDAGSDQISGNITDLKDGGYADRLLSMSQSFARCTKFIERLNKVPTKFLELNYDDISEEDENCNEKKKFIEYIALGKKIFLEDAFELFGEGEYDIKDVVDITDLDREEKIGFRNIRPTKLAVQFSYKPKNIIIQYHPTIDISGFMRLPEMSQEEVEQDLSEIGIPDEVAVLMPLYAKSEIFEEDDPTIATQARNKFDQDLALIDYTLSNVQTKVENVYGW